MIIAKKKVSNVVVYGADITDLQKKLKTVEKDLKKASREIENSAKAWTKLAAPIAAFGVAAVASFQKVEAALNKIRIGTGATGKALQGLQADFRKVASSSTSSLDSVATAIADLNTKLGLAGEPLQELSTQILNLSKLTGESAEALTGGISKAFQIAKVSTEDYSSTLDRLFTVSQNTGISTGILTSTFTQFAPTLAKLGLDINKSALLIGTLEKNGYSASTVISSLQTAMAKLAKAGARDVNGELVNLIDRLKNTSSESEKTAIAYKLFGGNAESMIQVIKSGSLDIDSLTKSLYENTNSINQTAKDTETLSDKWQKLTNSFSVNGSAIGNSLSNLASTVLDKLTTSFTSVNAAGADTVVRLGLIVAAIGPLQFAMSKLTGIAANVVGAFKNFAKTLETTKSFTSAFVASLTGPTGIALALTAVAAVIMNKYISSLQSAQAETAKLKKITDDLRASMALRTAEERSQQKKQLQAQIDDANRRIKEAESQAEYTTEGDVTVVNVDRARILKEQNALRSSLESQLGEYTRFDVIEDFKKQLTDAKTIDAISRVWATIPLELRGELKSTADYAKSLLTPVKIEGGGGKNGGSGFNVNDFIYGKDKGGSGKDKGKSAREKLVEEEKAALDSFRKLYADQDWTHQHGFADDTTYFNQLKDRLDKANALRRDSLEENQDTANSIWQSAIADMQAFGEQFAGQLKEKLDTGKISMDEAKNKAKEFADQLNAMGIPTVGSNLQKLADGTTSAQKAMDDLNKSAVQCLGNLKTGLIDAIVEGGNFADTLSNVGKQLMKIALNSMITPWFNGIFKGLIGAHTGGVIGIDPPSFVRSLPKFHTGGVVGANEQLAVLQTGEAVFTKEQQKALGGLIHKDTSVKDITINITNNGSGNMSNEQAQQLAKQIKAYVKTEVADEMYTYNRQKMYSMG